MVAPINWPASLPACAASWTEVDAPDILRSANDVGPPKVRRRSTLKNRQVSVSWNIRAEQYDEFVLFYETQCQCGVIPFYYKHPITHEIQPYSWLTPPSLQMIAGRGGVGAVQVSSSWELLE